MQPEPTNTEILKAVESFSTDILGAVNTFAEDVDRRFTEMNKEISGIKSNMVTKDYLDDKLSDLRGDLVVLTRKEDRKLNATLDLLVEKKVFSQDDAKRIQAMEPFPQLAL